jgi:hypothetical protein
MHEEQFLPGLRCSAGVAHLEPVPVPKHSKPSNFFNTYTGTIRTHGASPHVESGNASGTTTTGFLGVAANAVGRSTVGSGSWFARITLEAQGVDEERERGRGLPATRVVEVVAREWPTPVGERPLHEMNGELGKIKIHGGRMSAKYMAEVEE